ncbi:hypothetical protein GLOIN_2v1741550 [Rhizophagus clarus]|uniref:Uncharacterized protein n=1 Tax=Rhizophagus clarus TaxID=94130 RepID=A0A8H3LCI8_9GLOM|nr:hypothetical protein GLOIN_2v1741550 [Rhizophagus clarus]
MSLETIVNTEKGQKHEKAKELLDRYKKDVKPDYSAARKWRDDHESSDAIVGHSIHLHNPTFTKNLIGNSISGETHFDLSDNASKRSHQECEQTEQEFPEKRAKINQPPCTPVTPPHQIKSSGVSRTFPLETSGEIPLYDELSADETKEADPEFVNYDNYDNDPDYVYSTEPPSCDDDDDTVVDDSTNNPNDKIYVDEEVFTESELDEIREYNFKSMPEMPKDLLTYLNSFRVSNIPDLRNAILKSQQWDSPYNRQTHFDHDWIRNTMYNLLHEYESGSLEKDHLELWLLIHIWSFIDRVFGNVDGVEATRSESSSRASSNRKNRNRTVSAIVSMKRKIMGRRGDLIIRKVSTEYGCSEAGKSYEAVGMEENKIRKLQSIGFIHSGLMILLLRLDSPAGYTCRITRTKMLEIPSQIMQFGSKILPIIVLAWKAKMIVKDTIEFVEQKQYLENEEDTDDQLQSLQNSCEFSPPRKKVYQAIASDSPNKKNKPRKRIISKNKSKK